MFKPIKVRHISEEVFDQIKSAILDGKLKPGEKLPTEREMMKQLGVSRIPIREALKLLSSLGFVDTRQGGGTYVRSLLSDRVRDPLDHVIKSNAEKIYELLEVRREIETRSAYFAARRAEAEDIEKLRRIIEETREYCDKEKTPPPRLDADFHLAVAQCSQNTIWVHLTHTIFDAFAEYFRLLVEIGSFGKEHRQRVYSQHFNIYDAIRRRDAEGANRATIEHLALVEAGLRRRIAENEEKPIGGNT